MKNKNKRNINLQRDFNVLMQARGLISLSEKRVESKKNYKRNEKHKLKHF